MSELLKKIQDRIRECTRSNNTFERDTLKTLVGEIQTIQSRSGELDDDGVIKVLKKFKQGVLDTIGEIKGYGVVEYAEKFELEIAIYSKYIPTMTPMVVIIEVLQNTILDKLMAAKSDGQATGLAMGYFKKDNPDLPVDGKDVAEAVKAIRSTDKVRGFN